MKHVLLSILAIAFLGAASANAEDGTAKVLKVGVVVSLSGDAAVSGDAIRKGLELAKDELSAKGWRVDLGWQDGQTNSSKVISSIRYLSTQGYRLFVGPTWSFEVNAAKPALEQTGSLTIAPAGSSDINGAVSPSIFNLCPVRSRETSVLTEWLKTRKFKKPYILVPAGDWGVVHRKVFIDALKAVGAAEPEIDEYDYGWTANALKALMLKRKSSGADLILCTGAGGDIANMLKVRGELKWRSTFVATEDLWDSIDMKLVSSSAPELEDAWVIGLPLTGAFFEHFKARYHETPKVYADRGYDALMLFAGAVERADADPASVRKYLLDLKEYQGASGAITFSGDGDRATGGYRVMSAFENAARQ